MHNLVVCTTINLGNYCPVSPAKELNRRLLDLCSHLYTRAGIGCAWLTAFLHVDLAFILPVEWSARVGAGQLCPALKLSDKLAPGAALSCCIGVRCGQLLHACHMGRNLPLHLQFRFAKPKGAQSVSVDLPAENMAVSALYRSPKGECVSVHGRLMGGLRGSNAHASVTCKAQYALHNSSFLVSVNPMVKQNTTSNLCKLWHHTISCK